MSLRGTLVGHVVGNISPQEYRFVMKSVAARLGDLVYLEAQIPRSREVSEHYKSETVIVWGRIVELARYNPFLQVEAGQELAEEGLRLTDTVLSVSRDQVDGKVLILGMTREANDSQLKPLSYPISPGSEVYLPPKEAVQSLLIGEEKDKRITIGHLIGRQDYEVQIKVNPIVARHMAILAMTGGGKTVAARRIIRELLN